MNKLLYFIQTLYKNIEWAIGIDPEVLEASVKSEETKVLMQLLVEYFTKLPSTGSTSPLLKFNFEYVE